ncbi:MAG TPA: hypothetical protein VD997_01350 [Phycisphaerales bacterium]|nr:hypothetical protein [Phycisphaerales bacterium]
MNPTVKSVLSRSIVLAVVASAALLPGCIIVSRHEEPATVVLPEGKYTGAIRAAQAISFSDERTAALTTIARKDDLEEIDQHRIVYLLRRDGGYSTDKTNVAIALVENPNCTAATKNMIGSYAKDIASFSSDRTRLAAALSK